MADENKDVAVVTQNSTTETLDLQGKTMSNDTPLASMFDKIEAAKDEGKSAAEVIKEVQAEKPVKSALKEEKKAEPVKQEKTELEQKLEPKPEKKEDDAEISRRKLREDLSGKKEVKEEKKEEKAEETKEDEVSADELQVLPHDKPKTAKRIKALLTKIDTINSEVARTKTEAQEKATKLAELEKKLTEVKTVDPKTDEAVKKQLDELAMFRRRYDLEKDPEVKTKFDSRVEQAETSITSTLKKRGASDGLLAVIQEEGGWNKFADSNRVLRLADGKETTAAEVAEAVLASLPLSERRAIDAAMMEQIQTKRDRERFFKEEQDKAVEFFKKKDEEAVKQTEAQQNEVKAAAGKIEAWHKEISEKTDWLKVKEIPAGASAAEKAAIEEDNKYTKQLQGLLKKGLAPAGLEDALDVIFDSVALYQERREKSKLLSDNKRLQDELKAKQAEIDKFKAGGRSVPKAGSIAGGGSSAPTKEDKTPKSLEDAFKAIEQGANLGKDSDE